MTGSAHQQSSPGMKLQGKLPKVRQNPSSHPLQSGPRLSATLSTGDMSPAASVSRFPSSPPQRSFRPNTTPLPSSNGGYSRRPRQIGGIPSYPATSTTFPSVSQAPVAIHLLSHHRRRALQSPSHVVDTGTDTDTNTHLDTGRDIETKTATDTETGTRRIIPRL